MSALARETLACFHGGPCDGAVEPLYVAPLEMRFSSARIDGEWSSGTIRVADVLYRRDTAEDQCSPGCSPAIVHYRLAP